VIEVERHNTAAHLEGARDGRGMTTLEALSELGVSEDTLSEDEKAYLDKNGYLPLEGLLSEAEADGLRQRFDELVEVEGEDAGKEVHQEAGTYRLSNLIDKDERFWICISHPKVLAAMHHVLGDAFKLSSLNGRAALPGQGLQGLHADWKGRIEPGDYYVCNSIWLLSDFTKRNGATRVVPGSHDSGMNPREDLEDPSADHPDQVLLTAKKGTVVIFNSHTWHGGTLNQTDHPRYGLHGYYTRRDQKQQMDQKVSLSAETVGRLSDAQRVILDV